MLGTSEWLGAGPGSRLGDVRHHMREATMPKDSQGREDPGPSVKDDELYEKLRDEGNS